MDKLKTLKYYSLLKYFMVYGLIITATGTIGRDCCNKTTTAPPIKVPSCIDTAVDHRYYVEYDHMVNFRILEPGYGGLMYNAFDTKGNIVPYLFESNITSDSIIGVDPPYGGEEIADALGDYFDTYNNNTYEGYACGVDSLTIPFHNFIGLSGTDHLWSFVFVGVIRNTNTYQTDPPLYCEATVAHELAHQIGIPQTEHGIHDGNDSGQCVLHFPMAPYMVTPDIRFCDRHICYMYDNTPLLNAGGKNYDKDLLTTITAGKDTSLIGENIFIKFNFKNTGTSNLMIKNIFESNIMMNLEVLDSYNKKLPFRGVEAILRRDFPVSLLPGKDTTIDLELLFSYGQVFYGAIERGRRQAELPEGQYKIKFKGTEYEFGKDILSNQIEITIVPPTGEEYEVWNKLHEIYRIRSLSEQMKQFRDLCYMYPESRYMEQTFNKSLGVSSKRKPSMFKELIESCMWFIDKRPNSKYATKVVGVGSKMVYEYNSKDEEKYNLFLSDIISKYPNTRSSEVAKEFLKSKNNIR